MAANTRQGGSMRVGSWRLSAAMRRHHRVPADQLAGQFMVRREAYQRILEAFAANGISFSHRQVKVEMIGDKPEEALLPASAAALPSYQSSRRSRSPRRNRKAAEKARLRPSGPISLRLSRTFLEGRAF
jgi:hypothetical protein